MELLDIEEGKVIYLVYLRRAAGQLYVPEMASKLVERYNFVRSPTLEDLTSKQDSFSFGIGKYQGAQIQELRIYGDGVIVDSKSDTDLLDSFVDDLISWASKEFALVVNPVTKPERYYETSLVVRSDKDLSSVMSIPASIARDLNTILKEKSDYQTRVYQPTGFILDIDVHEPGGRRRTPKFILDRRVSIKFDQNVFFSQSPLRTKDHLAFLERLEALSR